MVSLLVLLLINQVVHTPTHHLGGSGKVDLDLDLSLEKLGVDIDDQWKQL